LVAHREYGRNPPRQRAIERRGRPILALPHGSTANRAEEESRDPAVVDDEEAVRALRRDLLSEVGFDVMEVYESSRMSGMWGSYLEAARRFGASAIFQKPLDIDRHR
jgi:hypothetical protein